MEQPSMTAAPDSDLSAARISARCWGTRGSIASPGPGTARYGGNTPCLEVNFDSGQRIIFDAGTGIRSLGATIAGDEGPVEAIVFLTHFHWDHIQGFPFFQPLYRPDASFRIIGPEQLDVDVQTLFAGQMGPIYFPIPFEALAAEKTFHHLNEGTWEEGDVRISAMRVKHPSYTVGYRIDYGGVSLGYVPDNELLGDEYDVPPDWRQRFVDFVGDVDVLIHDAMFTAREYEHRVGWGHSTFQQNLDLAAECGAKKLLFFHHAPDRDDAELSEIAARCEDIAGAGGKSFVLDVASEGDDILI